jgi:transposase
MAPSSTKPANVDYFRLPRPLWRQIKRHLPKPPQRRGPGRPPADTRAVITGIWYVLWTGCQWKAVHRSWFGVASSVLHARLQQWQREGRFAAIMTALVRFYNRRQRRSHRQKPDRPGEKGHETASAGRWARCPVVAGHYRRQTGRDRRGGVGHHGAGGARPTGEQHVCGDRGYDARAVHEFLLRAGYSVHSKHRRWRGEPPTPAPDIPGEAQYPARRWVVERTFSWLVKRRSIRPRWCKKVANWLALVQLACADMLCAMAIYG